MELGCNEGPITRALIEPALWLEPSDEWKERFKSASQVNDHPFLQLPSIAPKKIICVDIDVKTLSGLAKHLDARAKNEQNQSILRFSELVVELNATDYRNLLFSNGQIDVLVASEFIEHLDDDCLNEFGPRVLGAWKPKVVLITTPNYSFNVKFKKPQHPSSIYTDPTGRTDRQFRHSDHKFEWTKKEFQTWTEKVAKEYGYSAKFEGVGRGYRIVDGVKQEDLTDGDDARFASHCCILTQNCPDRNVKVFCEPQNKDSSPTNHKFKASNLRFRKDGARYSFENAFIKSAFVTEKDLMANAYHVWLDENVRKTYCGKLENFLPDGKFGLGTEYSLVKKDGDLHIQKK